MKIIPNSETIDAVYVTETTSAWLLDCEGDEVWFGKSQVNFDKKAEKLEAPIWLLKKTFPGEF